MKCIVVHVRKGLFKQGHPDCVYIGRDYQEFGDEGWGNPFHIGPDGDRAEVLAKYRAWIMENEYLLKRLPELRGKVLGCWCKPDSCHGDILVELVNQLPEPEKQELYDADPNCEHEIVPNGFSGVKCAKCPGWFCY